MNELLNMIIAEMEKAEHAKPLNKARVNELVKAFDILLAYDIKYNN